MADFLFFVPLIISTVLAIIFFASKDKIENKEGR